MEEGAAAGLFGMEGAMGSKGAVDVVVHAALEGVHAREWKASVDVADDLCCTACGNVVAGCWTCGEVVGKALEVDVAGGEEVVAIGREDMGGTCALLCGICSFGLHGRRCILWVMRRDKSAARLPPRRGSGLEGGLSAA